jgi:hypothetical protein
MAPSTFHSTNVLAPSLTTGSISLWTIDTLKKNICYVSDACMHGLNHSFLRMGSKRRHTGWTSQSREREREAVVVLYLVRATRERRRGMCAWVHVHGVALFSQRENRTGEAMNKRPAPAGRVGSSLGLRESKGNAKQKRIWFPPSNMRIYQEFKILDHSPCCSLQINPTSSYQSNKYVVG